MSGGPLMNANAVNEKGGETPKDSWMSCCDGGMGNGARWSLRRCKGTLQRQRAVPGESLGEAGH